MWVISSGLWVDQTPSSEDVAGVCLLLRPGPPVWRAYRYHGCSVPEPKPEIWPQGYSIDLLTTFEHPVDTRPRSFEKAFRLALTDLPAAGPPLPDLDVDRLREQLREPFCMRSAPSPLAFTPVREIWSRAHYWHASWHSSQRSGSLSQVRLHWRAGEEAPEASGDTASSRTHNLAWAQAALLADC